MTAMSLRKFPARNALRVVKQNMKMTIVTCILQIISIPLAISAGMFAIIAESKEMDYYHLEMYMALGMLLLGAAVFMGLFAAIFSFWELHKKTSVDMLYALPLTGKQRFFSDYIGGCLMYIVPYVIAVILGWIIMLGMAPFVNWQGVEMTFGEFMGEAGKMYAMASFGLLVLMLLYYTLSVFVTVCCGTLFESIYTNILLNCLIPGTAAVVLAIIAEEVGLGFEDIWQFIGFMSPIGGLIYLILLLSGDIAGASELGSSAYRFAAAQDGVSHAMLPSYLRWIIIILLLTAALLVAAWQLYARRKAEDVGKPFIYVAAYYVMLTLGTVLILCLLYADAVGPALILSAIVYFVMEIIRRRGFKRFWLSIATYLATVAVSVAGFFLVTGTGCFGRVSYVPAPAAIKSVILEFEDANNNNFDYALEYTDDAVISGITEIHRSIIQDQKTDVDNEMNRRMLEERWCELNYNEYNDSEQPLYWTDLSCIDHQIYAPYDDTDPYFNGTWKTDPNQPIPEGIVGNYGCTTRFSITYYTVAGTMIHRTYTLNADRTQQVLQLVYGTSLYAQARADGLRARLENEYAVTDSDYKRQIPSRISFVTESNTSRNYMTHAVTLDNAPEQLERLVQAYQSDLEQMTAQDFVTAECYCCIQDLEVYTCCKNTIAVLDSFGIKPFNTAERYAFLDRENAAILTEQNEQLAGSYMGIRIYTPEMSRTASELYPHSTASTIYFKSGEPAYEDLLIAASGTSLKDSYPELYELLGALRSNYVTDEDCYVVVIRGRSYVLPKSQEALAQAVIAKGSHYAAKQMSYGDLIQWDGDSGSGHWSDREDVYPNTAGGWDDEITWEDEENWQENVLESIA